VAVDHSECGPPDGCKHQALLPDRMELIHGPYDGIIYHPRTRQFFSTLHELEEIHGGTGNMSTPTQFGVYDHDLVLVGGNASLAAYRRQTENRWTYVYPAEAAVLFAEASP
jgi:hypothetical protein